MIMKSAVQAPKLAKLPWYLKKLAKDLELNLEIETDKGIFFETVRFQVEGSRDKVVEFRSTLEKAVEEWERR